jgi:flavin reductase
MRDFVGAVTVITTGRPDGRAGLTATAAMSLTATPPRVAVAVNHDASAYPAIVANGAFVVNVLSVDQSAIADGFSGRDGRKRETRFDTGEWIELKTGMPVLREAVASFDCRTVSEIPVGTHSLFVGEVEAVSRTQGAAPLLFAQGRWGGLISSTDDDVVEFRDIVKDSIRIVDAAHDIDGVFADKLAAFVRGYTKLMSERQHVTLEFIRRERFVPVDTLSELTQLKGHLDRRLGALLADGLGRSKLSGKELRLVSYSILAMLTWLFRWYRLDDDIEAVEERLSGLILAMLKVTDAAACRRPR